MNHHNEVIHQNESDFRLNYDRKHLILFLSCSTVYSTVQLNKTKQNIWQCSSIYVLFSAIEKCAVVLLVTWVLPVTTPHTDHDSAFRKPQ